MASPNIDVMNRYDAGALIEVPVLVLSDPALHHAAHCLAFEVLRGLMSYTVAAYVLLDPEVDVPPIYDAAALRILLNPASAATGALLTTDDKAAAAVLGTDYFTRGYHVVIAGVSQYLRRSFLRINGDL